MDASPSGPQAAQPFQSIITTYEVQTMSYLAIVYDQADGNRSWSVFEPQATIRKNPNAPVPNVIEQQQFVRDICNQVIDAYLHDDDEGRIHFLGKCLLQEVGNRPIMVHSSHLGEVSVSSLPYATAKDAEACLLELWPNDVQ
jgi:hypothetical protein